MSKRVGARVAVDQHLGTIRFHGPVPRTAPATPANTWYGIEWDDGSRGKHSGTHEGVTYFRTLVENAGSFVRASSKKIVFGRSFLSALRQKYAGDGGDGDAEGVMHDATVAFGGDTKIEVETVGWDKVARKQARLDALREVGLGGERISGVVGFGDEETTSVSEEIAKTCPAITDLDLSRNLVSRWEDVAGICVRLPSLRALQVSHNRFQPLLETSTGEGDEDEAPTFNLFPPICIQAFGNLRALAMINTLVTWTELRILGRWLCSIEELYVAYNNLGALHTTHAAAVPGLTSNDQVSAKGQFLHPTEFPHLRILDLEANALASWSEIEHLAYLPNLSQLMLTNNNIPQIRAPPSTPPATLLAATDSNPLAPFAALRVLHLSNNKISEWSSIHALNAFPALAELRFRDNPVTLHNVNTLTGITTTTTTTTTDATQPTRLDRHSALIARVAGLRVLNGTVVSARDRQDAEIYYLDKISEALWDTEQEQERSAKGDPPADTTDPTEYITPLLQLHPRYPELLRKWGDPLAEKRAAAAGKGGLAGAVLGPTVSAGAAQLKNRVLALVFVGVARQGADAGDVELAGVEKKVPVTMSVRNLRAVAVRIVGAKGGKRTGSKRAGERMAARIAALDGSVVEVPLDDDMKDLDYYGVGTGDQVIVYLH